MTAKCRLILSLFLTAVLLSDIVAAVPDSAVTGPYKISFDLGLPHDVYSVKEVPPVTDETLGGDEKTTYSIAIAKKSDLNQLMMLSVIKAKTLAPPGIMTGEIAEAILESKDSGDPRIANFDSDTRKIDGEEGAVASFVTEMTQGEYVTGYHAMYMPSFSTRDTLVDIVSTFLWNEGTLQLLKTIHVEEVK
jgi:hypothetical protein